jgi:hypothetical protein
MLLVTAPIVAPVIGSVSGETTVKAADNNYIDFDENVEKSGPTSLGFYVNVDGQEKEVWTQDLVYITKVGDVKTQETPALEGYVANQNTISILRTKTGYRLLQVPSYTKSTSDEVAKSATTEFNKEVIRVDNLKNINIEYCPLYGFSTDTGKVFNISNRALANGTKWYSDQIKTYDGVKYYRVATNEWVKADCLAGTYTL